MRTLHLVSHTHWDREWYLPFQLFRLKLVHLVDNLLAILDNDPDFRHFMLDGQTIVLEDYLEMRPEMEETLARFVEDGRLLIGPWYILPDEFLVSPEATIRNLLEGDCVARRFGGKVMVGYLPDTFGHIGQMPQILRGFDMKTACVWRGVPDLPCEVWWQAPDESRVLLAHLRESYSNAAGCNAADVEQFTTVLRRGREALAKETATPHLLFMYGTDHMEPHPNTSAAIAYANEHLDGDSLIHSTLPDYLEAAQENLRETGEHIPVHRGEFRDCSRSNLLPAVLSSRMWIKQRNHASQTLLEKWAEPFSTWTYFLANTPGAIIGFQPTNRLKKPAGILRNAWRLLMQNHPHDSICGCSIDQVHEEMKPRFDQVDQIGEEITRQSLEALAAQMHTDSGPDGQRSALVVFNPLQEERSDILEADVQPPDPQAGFEIVDDEGEPLPFTSTPGERSQVAYMELDREGLSSLMDMASSGALGGMTLVSMTVKRTGDLVILEPIMAENGQPDEGNLQAAMAEIMGHFSDPGVQRFVVIAYSPAWQHVRLVASGIPGCGWRTFWLRPVQTAVQEEGQPPQGILENKILRVEVSPRDGTFTLTDLRNGVVYGPCNRFVDGGDRGDEYNFNPPEEDVLVDSGMAMVKSITTQREGACQRCEIVMSLPVPASLTADRKGRRKQTSTLHITTRLEVYDDIPRLDIHTSVENMADDHRLRVHFGVPFDIDHADYDGHFEVRRRDVEKLEYDSSWMEAPRPEAPQRTFTDLSNGRFGLMLANRGLPEVEAIQTSPESAELALTLLRCVGWLSRDDLSLRRGNAGPSVATPGAQMHGRWEFDYALIPHSGGWRRAFGDAQAFNVPLRGWHTSLHEGDLPGTGHFLDVKPETFAISAIKMAEDGSGWIVRGVNLLDEEDIVHITPWRKFGRVVRVNLAEDELDELQVDEDGTVKMEIDAFQIATIKFIPVKDDDRV